MVWTQSWNPNIKILSDSKNENQVSFWWLTTCQIGVIATKELNAHPKGKNRYTYTKENNIIIKSLFLYPIQKKKNNKHKQWRQYASTRNNPLL